MTRPKTCPHCEQSDEIHLWAEDPDGSNRRWVCTHCRRIWS